MVGELSRPILFSLKWYWNYNIYIFILIIIRFGWYTNFSKLHVAGYLSTFPQLPFPETEPEWDHLSLKGCLHFWLTNHFFFFIGTLIHYFTTYGCCNVKMLSKCKMCDFCINCMYQFILFKTWYTFPLVLLCFMLKCVLHKENYCLRG